ncbi:two-component system sensor histidine kinase AtoS [Orbaceae bacterium ac157xtp]
MIANFIRHLYPDKISARMFLLISILVTFSVIIVAFFIEKEGKELLIEEKSNKLYAVTKMLDLILEDAYLQIDPNLPKEDQIKQLNQKLSPKVESLISTMPKIGAGYYHKKLNAIIVYAPNNSYGINVGKSIDLSHKGHAVMQQGIAQIDIGKQVRGNIMNAMIPITRNNEVLGYIWANETINDIDKQTMVFDKKIIFISLVCVFSCILVASILSKKLNADIEVIKKGLQVLPYDLNKRLPIIRGELNEIVNGINKLAEKLNKAKTMNELILENSLDGVISVDNNSAITMLNPAAERMTGHKLKDVIGKPYCTLWDDKNFQSPLIDTLYNGVDHVGVEVDFPVANQILRISTSTTHLKDHQGNIIGALVIFKDITERKEVENLIQQTERLVAIGELMAGIAHEIRNPLAAIRGFVQYLQKDLIEAEQKEYTNIILNEVDSINKIIQQLLDFSAPSKHYYNSISINELIEEVLVLINSSHRSNNITFTLNLDGTLTALYLDEKSIKQAILNLIINSIQAIKDKGFIHISTSLSKNGKYQLITIKDNGVGINPEIKDKIFMPFFTTKVSGTGLGLSIVQKIVSSHKGKITLQNNVDGKGVTIEVALPTT